MRGPAPEVAHAANTTASLVVFWADWCEPCRREAPDLAALAADLPAGLGVILYTHDDSTAPAEKAFAGVIGPRMRVLPDADKAVARSFGVEVLPASVLVAGHDLAARFDGPRQWNSPGMRRLLGRLLGAGAPEGG